MNIQRHGEPFIRRICASLGLETQKCAKMCSVSITITLAWLWVDSSHQPLTKIKQIPFAFTRPVILPTAPSSLWQKSKSESHTLLNRDNLSISDLRSIFIHLTILKNSSRLFRVNLNGAKQSPFTQKSWCIFTDISYKQTHKYTFINLG